MPPVIAVIQAIGALIPGIAAATTAATVAGTLIVASAALALRSLIPKVDMGVVDTDRSRQTTVRSTIEPRKLIYGETMVSGVVSFAQVNGTNNKNLHQVIAIAGHKLTSIDKIFFDDYSINLSTQVDGSGDVTSGKFAKKTNEDGVLETMVHIETRDGSSTQTAYSDLVTAFAGTGVNAGKGYESTHRGDNVASIYTRWTIHEGSAETWDEVGGIQNIKAVVKGKAVYDPRLDVAAGNAAGANPTTAAYITYSNGATTATHQRDLQGQNPALILADYLMDATFGLGVPSTKIDWAAVITAADACDFLVPIPTSQTQKRFFGSGVIFGSDNHRKSISKILSGMNGDLIYSQGKYIIKAGIHEAASLAFTEDDLAGDFTVKTSIPRADRYNTIKGMFIDPDSNYKMTEFSPRTVTGAVARDNGEVLEEEIKLTFTSDRYVAQRIAIKKVHQSFLQTTLMLPVNLKGMKVAVGDRITLALNDFATISSDWNPNKEFKVIGWSFSESGSGAIELNLVEDDSSRYVDPAEGEYNQISNTGVITSSLADVPLPTNFTATAGYNSVNLAWTNPTNIGAWEQIWIYASDTTTPPTTPIEKFRGTAFTHQIAGGTTKYYWIQAVKYPLGATPASGSTNTAKSALVPFGSPTAVTALKIANAVMADDSINTAQIIDDAVGSDQIATALQSSNWSVQNQTGWRIEKSGDTTFNNTVVRGNISASTGSIGGITVDADSIYVGTGTFNNANTAFYADDQGQFSLKDKLSWDGSALTISGQISATTGAIGGFSIGSDYIADAADSMGLASTVTAGDDVRFWAGDTFANRASAPFRVTEAGALTATNATITGAITATSGSIGNTVTVGGTAASTVASGAASGATASQVNKGLALLLNQTTSGGSGPGEASLVGVDKTGTPETGTDGFIQWDGSKVTIERNQYSTTYTILTGLGGKRGFIAFDVNKTDAFTVNGAAMDVAFVYKEGNQWYYDPNNASGVSFNPDSFTGSITGTDGTTNAKILAIGYLETSTPDLILTGGLFDPISLKTAAFPGDDYNSGTIGGININTSAIYSGSKSSFADTDKGFWIGSNGTMSFANGTANTLEFDTNGDLSITGDITATSGTFTGTVNASSGAFTGDVSTDAKFIAGSNSSTVTLDGTTGANYSIFAGADNSLDASFKVASDGVVEATRFIIRDDANGQVLIDTSNTANPFSGVVYTSISQGSGAGVDTVAGTLANNAGEITITTTQAETFLITAKVAIDDNDGSTNNISGASTVSTTDAENQLKGADLKIEYYLKEGAGAYALEDTEIVTFTEGTPSSSQIKVFGVDRGAGYSGSLTRYFAVIQSGGAAEFVTYFSTSSNANRARTYAVTTASISISGAGTHKIKILARLVDAGTNTTLTNSTTPALVNNNATGTYGGSGIVLDASQSPPNQSSLDNFKRIYEATSANGFVVSAANTFAIGEGTTILTSGGTISGNLVITGDLTVSGTTTTVNTDDLTVKDPNITLNYSTGDSSSTANNAGITIQDAVDSTTDASILWKTATDSFDFSHKIIAPLATTIKGSAVTGAVVGQYAGLVINDSEGQIQVIAEDTGSWASNIVLSNYTASTRRHYWLHNAPSSSGVNAGKFELRTSATTTAGQIGGQGSGSTALLVVDSSGNSAFSGTISSGAITSSGVVTATGGTLTGQLNVKFTSTSGVPDSTETGIYILDEASVGVDNGGSIVFSGIYTGSSGFLGSGPYIKAYKLNATDGDYSYGLKFGVRKNNVGAQTLALTIDDDANANFAAKVVSEKVQHTSDTSTNAHFRALPSGTTDTTGLTSVFLGTSTNTNYGISLSGARKGTDGTPTFALRTHNNSTDGVEVLTIADGGAATFAGAITSSGNLNLTSTTPIIDLIAGADNDSTIRLRESGTGIVGAELIYDGSGNEFQFKIGNNSANTAFTIARDTAQTTFAQNATFSGAISSSGRLTITDATGGDGSWTGGILINNTATTTGEPAIAFKNAATGSNYWIAGLNQDANFAFNYGTGFSDTTNKMTLTSDGKLGINGLPDPTYNLQVNGNSFFMSKILIDQDSVTSGAMSLEIFNSEADSYTSDALTAYNASTSWDIADKTTLAISSRPDNATIYTYMGEAASTSVGASVQMDRIIQLNNSASNIDGIRQWIFYQYDGSGTSANDFKVPNGDLFDIKYYDGSVGNVDALKLRHDRLSLFTTSATGHFNLGASGGLWQFILNNTDTGGNTWYMGGSDDGFSSGGGRFLISNGGTASTAEFTINGTNIGINQVNPDHALHVKGDVTIDNESETEPSMLHFNASGKTNLDPTSRINFWEGDGHAGTYTGAHSFIEYNGSAAQGGNGYLAIGGYGDTANEDYLIITRGGPVKIRGYSTAAEYDSSDLLLFQAVNDSDGTPSTELRGQIGSPGAQTLTLGSGAVGLIINEVNSTIYPWTMTGNTGTSGTVNLGLLTRLFANIELKGEIKSYRDDEARYSRFFHDNSGGHLKTNNAGDNLYISAAAGGDIYMDSGSSHSIDITGPAIHIGAGDGANHKVEIGERNKGRGFLFEVKNNSNTITSDKATRMFMAETGYNAGSASYPDNYGLSLVYDGMGTTVFESGFTSTLANGQWGFYGHENNDDGVLIIHSNRGGTFFKIRTSDTDALHINSSQYSEFFNGIDVKASDTRRLRFLSGSTFKGGVESATTAGDMVGTSAIDDLCIRSETNILFATGGNTQRFKIATSGNAEFAGSVTGAGNYFSTKAQHTSSTATVAHFRAVPSATTDTTGLTSIFLGTSTNTNYGVSISAARKAAAGTPTFSFRTHNNNADGSEVLTIADDGAAAFASGISSTSLSVTSTSNSAIYVTGSGAGLYLTGGNNRIYFGGRRALEGSTDGATLQIGEQYDNIRLQGTKIWAGDTGDVAMTIGYNGNTGTVTAQKAKMEFCFGATISQSPQIRFSDTGGDLGWTIGANDYADNALVIDSNNSGTPPDIEINQSYTAFDFAFLPASKDFYASGNITAYSDRRIKDNIETIDNALDRVMNMRGVFYTRKDLPEKGQQTGVIAQEMREQLPQVVSEDSQGMLTVSYGNIVGTLIEAIKDQQQQINDLKQTIESLKNGNDEN